MRKVVDIGSARDNANHILSATERAWREAEEIKRLAQSQADRLRIAIVRGHRQVRDLTPDPDRKG
jgi:hypothetical protein